MSMTKQKAIERAQKLLAMAADSASPNEAAIAARRARSIIDQYQLSLIDLEAHSEFSQVGASKSRKSTPLWEQPLCTAIAKLNDCKASILQGMLTFSGFDTDVQIAKFMLMYLVQNGLRQCRQQAKAHKTLHKPFSSNNFKLGYSMALAERLQALSQERCASTTCNALVSTKKQVVAKQFGVTEYKTKKVNMTSDSGFNAGRDEGKAVNITTGIEGAATENRKVS